MKIAVTSLSQLNALVAERVMGFRIVGAMARAEDGLWRVVPHYSTDLNAAGEVARLWGLRVQFLTQATAVEGRSIEMVVHTSPAVAICLAALKCEGVDVELKLEEEV